MPSRQITVLEARSVDELRAAAKIRYDVYAPLMPRVAAYHNSGLELNGYDIVEQSTIFLALVDGEAAGTIRLLSEPCEAVEADVSRFVLPLGHILRYENLPRPARFGELGRLAVQKRYRDSRVVRALYRRVYEKSCNIGVTHWLGSIMTECDSYEDASIMIDLMTYHGLKISKSHAYPTVTTCVPSASKRPYFSDEDRQLARDRNFDKMELPASIRINIASGVEIQGPPVYLEAFDEFAIPAIVGLADFKTSAFGKGVVGGDA